MASDDECDAARWLALARRGDFDRAWEASDRILARHAAHPDFTKPRHFQSILDGGAARWPPRPDPLLSRARDTIQFIRYAPLVRARARQVLLWVQPALIPLLEGFAGVDRLIPLHEGAPDGEYDVDLEVMELPFVFRSTLATLPRDIPYLRVPPAALPAEPPCVGIVWRAGDWETGRSLPFEAVCPLARVCAALTASRFPLGRARST